MKRIKKVVNERSPKGERYTGEKKEGNRDGLGECSYQDGSIYRGNWDNSRRSGTGKLLNNKEELVYDGGWLDDEFHGHGVLHNVN